MIHAIQRLARDMTARVFRQELVADNLANATTAGFKAQRAFASLLKDMQGDEANQIGRRLTGIYTSFLQGPLETTGRNLDLSIQGEGFFVVQTPSGERYTRAGSFSLSEEGVLTTQSGNPVLGGGGPITLTGPNLTVAPDGTILVDGEEIDLLRIAVFDDPQSLAREGNMFAAAGAGPRQAEPGETQVLQGALERSNASPIDEMVEMISLHRGFEADQRSIGLQDDSVKSVLERIGNFKRG
jgi:flagellar basal-body rod protein FlgF